MCSGPRSCYSCSEIRTRSARSLGVEHSLEFDLRTEFAGLDRRCQNHSGPGDGVGVPKVCRSGQMPICVWQRCSFEGSGQFAADWLPLFVGAKLDYSGLGSSDFFVRDQNQG
jgi:hypothetical protein